MQKVEGSSPFIRSPQNSLPQRVFVVLGPGLRRPRGTASPCHPLVRVGAGGRICGADGPGPSRLVPARHGGAGQRAGGLRCMRSDARLTL